MLTAYASHFKVMSTDDVSSQNFSDRNSGFYERSSHLVYESDNYIRRTQNSNNNNNNNTTSQNNNSYNPQATSTATASPSPSSAATATVAVAATVAAASSRAAREQRDCLFGSRNGPFSSANILSERSANSNTNSPIHQQNNRVPPSSSASWYDIATTSTNGPGGSGNVGASVAGGSINSSHNINQHHHYYTNTSNATTAHSSTTSISLTTPPASSTIATASATTTTLASLGSATYQRGNSHDSGLINKRNKINKLYKSSSAGAQSSVESPLPATTESAPTTATLTTSYSNSSCSTISSNNNPNLSSNSNSTTSCSSGIVSNSILNAMTSATVEAVNSTSSNSGHCGETTAAAATATATTANASYASSSSTIPSANASNSNNNNNSNSTTSHSATRVTHARCTTSSSRSHSRSPSSYSSSHSSSSSSHASSHTSSPILGVETSVSSGRGATARNQMQSAVSTPIHGSSNNPSGGGACSSSSSSSSSSGSCPTVTNPVVHSEDNRPLAIRVRNLPGRSSDTSLKDGLFHEYKKHGKVTWVKVVGQNSERYALVCFKKPEDVEKALEVSHDKLFFGCKIEVEPYQGYDVEDNEFRPYEAELDEYHPKSTRTLFIGNLEKDITASELRGHFENFGEIIEIDIKKQGMNAYAFCQYSDIVSVVKAMRKMDGEHLGNNRIKLGFGKSMPTNCVWIDGIGEKISESHLQSQFSRYGTVTKVIVDRVRQLGLVLYEQIQYAQTAVKEMRGTTLRGRRLQVDFASRECQDAFYEKLEKQNTAGRFSRYDSQSRSRASSFSRHQNSNDGCSPSNTPGSSSGSSASCAVPPTLSSAIVTGVSGLSAGNNAIPSTGATGLTSVVGQVTSVLSGGSSTPARSRGIRSMRSHTIDYDFADVRRFRAYDEYSQGSAASHDEDASGGTPVTPLHSTYTSAVGSSGLRSDSPLLSRLGPIVGSAAAPVSANESFEGTLNSGRRRCDKSPGKQKGDIRVLQKERFHLLEQLEECPSSGDENIASPRKRIKTDHHHSSNISSGLDASSIGETHRSNLNSNCDSNQHDPTLHRKGDMRRLSDFGKYHLQPPHQQQQHLIQQHLNRRPSNDLSANISSAAADHNSIRHNSTSSSSSEHYGQHQLHGTTPHLPSSTVPCKRRRVVSGGNCNSSLSSSAIIGAGSSNLSGSHNSMVNDDFHHHASRGRGHPLHSHHSHEASCGESADGSRPGTPLCDERPEVLPTEPRRVPRERPHEPMVLPLPKFGIQFFQQYRNSGGVSTSNATSAYHHHSGNLSSSLTNPHVNYGLSNSHLGGNNSCSSHSSLNHNLTSSSATLGSAHLPSPSSRYPHWRPHHHHHHSQLSSAGGGSSTSSLSASVVSPLRPRSLSSNSSDSDVQAQPSGSPSLEERIRTLDEMYERWSGGSAVSSAAIKRHDFSHGNTPSWQIHREHSSNSSHMPTGTINSLNASMAGPTARHKFLDLDVNELQPSEIVKSVLAKKSLFDDDLQRLKKNQWLEPTPADITLNSSAVSSGLPNLGAASKSPVVGSTNSSTVLSRPGALLQRLSSLSPMNSPQASMSPYNSPSPSPSVSCSFSTPSTIQKQSATTAPPTVPTMPVPTTPTTSSTATKGLQYPFPSHPPLPSTAAPGPVAQPPLPAEQSKLPPMPAEQPPPPIAQGDAHTDLTKQKPNIIKSLSVPMNSSIQVEKPSSSTLPAAEAARMLIKSVSVPGSTNIGTVKILSSTIKSSPEQVPTSGNSSSTTSSTSNKLESDNTKPSKSVTVPTAATANTSSPATSKKNEKSHKHIHRNDSEKKSKHERSSEKRKKSLTSTPRVEEETSDSDNGGKTNDKSSAVLTVVDKEKLDRENLEKEKQQKQQRELERQEREKRERELKRQQEKEEREHKEREEREKRENDERERAAKLEKDRLEREERARIEREECERRTKDENERRQREENDRKQQKAEQERQERERRSKMEKERIGIEERDHTERRNKDDTEKHAIKAEIPKLDKDGLDHHIASGSNVQRLAPSQVLSSTSALDVEKQNNKENTANIETSMENSLTNKHHSVRKSSRSSPIRHPKRRLSSHDNTSGNNASETNNGDENAKRMRIEGQENHGSSNSANSNISAKDKEGHTKDLSHRSSNKHHHHHHHQRQHSSSSHKSEHAVASSGIVGCSNAEKSKNREHSSKYKSKHHNKSSSHGHSLTSFHNQNQLHGVPVNESNSVNESENLDSSSLPKNQPGAESVLAVKLNNQHEDISSDQEQEPGHAHIAKTNSSDDEDLHTSQGHHQNLTKTPSHGSHHTQHRHREHHSSSRHKSKREHRDKKRHSIAESSTGNTMTDEEVGSNNAAHSVHRRISAGGSTTSDTATPTTRESKSKSSDHALSGSHRSDRKLSRCSEDGSNILPNTPTCRMGGNKNTPLRKMIMSSADSDDSEDTAAAKKRSIFDIPDDGPYVSMYDKVKARSCKNMQKQEEEKKIKAKFSQLKQSRAKREEKKRSASYDGDSDSEFDEQMNHRIGGDSGSYRSRNHGGLTSSSDGGGMDDGDDEESIIARRRSSQASSSRRKFSDSDSTTAAEVAEDAARRMRTHENLLRLCDGDDSSDDEIRNNAKRSSPSKRLKATKRSIHAIQRIASDSESQSQPPAIVDIKIKQEIKHLDESTAQSFESGEMEGKIKDTIKKEPHTAPESDIELKLKRRSSISSGDDQQLIPPMNVKMEPGVCSGNMLSTDEIKKEYKAIFDESYELNLPEHKVKEMMQHQTHYSPEGGRKKHKKSKKRQKGNTITMLEGEGSTSLHFTTANALETVSKVISGSALNTTVGIMNATGEQKNSFDVFDELKRQDSVKLEPTTPTVGANNGNSSDFLAVNNNEKKRHKDRKEKKREKLRSIGGSDISTTVCGPLVSPGVDVDKLSKEERHRLKKSKKSKSLELVRASHTPTTSACVNISPYATPTALKRIEGKMEDIFGPISDEESQFSDIVCKEFSPSAMKLGDTCASTPTTSNVIGPIVSAAINPYKQDPLTPKSHTVEENEENILKVCNIGVSATGGSTTGVGSVSVSQSERERQRKEKREKKRREREKSREQHALSALQKQQKHHECLDDENSVDLDEAGRALEAQLMDDSDNKITEDATPSTATTYRSDMTDVFRFSDGDENSVELLQSSATATNKKDGALSHVLDSTLVQNMQQQPSITKLKEKKKKKKRSKDEKHHHQRRESSCSSTASSSHHVQAHVQQTSSATSMMSPPAPNSGVPSIGKLTVDILAATKHSQMLENQTAAVDEDDNIPNLPICKPSPSLPCLIGDDDDDITLCRPKTACKPTITPIVSATTTPQNCTDSLSLSPIREKQMISPIPKTPTTTNTSKEKDKSAPKTPGTPVSTVSIEASALKNSSTSTPLVIKTDDFSTNSLVSSALSPDSIASNLISQKKKPENFIPGFDGELDQKISESAVQSISAELNTPVLDPNVDEPKIPVESPPDASMHLEKIEDSKSRVQISQEETESAVSALLGESFGNSSTADFDAYNDVGCLEDLAEPTVVAGVDEEAAIAARSIEGSLKEPIIQTEEECEEVSMAIQSLSTSVDVNDIKPPDTPQSDRGLQIDTDTEDNNADEADSSGNSLKIDETTRASLTEEVSDKPEKSDLLTESVDTFNKSVVSAASVITKLELTSEPKLTETSSDKTKVKDSKVLKLESEKDTLKSESKSSKVSTAELPSMISLEEPLDTKATKTDCAKEVNTSSNASVAVKTIPPLDNSIHAPTTQRCEVKKHSSEIALPNVHFMQPPTISIPDLPVNFALPQMTISPRSSAAHDRHNLSPRPQPIKTLQSPKATISAANSLQDSTNSGANTSMHHSIPSTTLTVTTKSSQHSASNVSAALSSPGQQGRAQQTQPQQKALNVSQSTSNSTFSISPSTPQLIQLPCTANNNNNNKNNCKSQSPSVDRQTVDVQGALKVAGNSTGVTLLSPTTTRPSQMRVVQPCQMVKSVIEHGSVQHQQQQHGPMSITVQKIPPVTAHPTIISKVVNVQPQKAQQLSSPTRPLHSPIQQQQQQVGHLLPISTVQKTITNPYHQQQQKHEQNYLQPQSQHHILQSRSTPIQKVQQLPQKLQQQQQQQTQQPKPSSLGLSVPNSTSTTVNTSTSGTKTTVVISNQSHPNTSLFRQQQQQQPHQQPISPNMSMGIHQQQQQQQQQANTSISQSIIVQQQIVGRPSQAPEQAQQHLQQKQQQHTSNNINKSATHLGSSTFVPKQVSPSIVIEPLGLVPNVNKEIEKSPTTTSTTLTSTNTFTNVVSMSAVPQITVTPSNVSDKEKLSIPPNKVAENVSVIMNPPTPTSNNRTNSVLSSEVQRSPVLEANTTTSMAVQGTITEVSITTKDEKADHSWPQKPLKDSSGTDSVIKKADKTEDNPSKPIPTSVTATVPTTSSNVITTPATSENTVRAINESNKESVSTESIATSSTDHDTEDETETKQSMTAGATKSSVSMTIPSFEQVALSTNTQITVGKATRGGGAKRGRQPRGGKKQAAGLPTAAPIMATSPTDSDSGIQTRLRKPLTVSTVTRGRKGRPPRNALLTQRALQQQQQEFNQQQQMQQTVHPSNAVPPAKTSILTAAEKKERNQTFNTIPMASSAASTASSDQDVYEFHDESTEELRSGATDGTNEDTRPRLILTIKSPGHASSSSKATEKPLQTAVDPLALPVTSPEPLAQTTATHGQAIASQKHIQDLAVPSQQTQCLQQPTTPGAIHQQQQQPHQQQEDHLHSNTNAVTAASNTRKSRRLQEKDRSTIDDIIEDVVRNTQTPPPALALPKGAQTPPRRSGRNVATNPKKNELPALALPHTPNAVGRPRRSKDRKSSENSVEQSSPNSTEQQSPKQQQTQQASATSPAMPKPKNISTENVSAVPPVDEPSVMPKHQVVPENVSTEVTVTQAQSHSVSPVQYPSSLTITQHHPQHPKKKAIAAAEIESYAAAVAAAAMNNNPSSVSALPPGGLPMLHTAAPSTQKVTGGTADAVNKSLIDPVTGLISGMQQGKEGNLPMATAAIKKMLPSDNVSHHQSHPATDTIRSSPPVIHKLPPCTTATALHVPVHNQMISVPPPSQVCSIATPITALTKPVQTEAAAPATTLTVPASLANKPVSVVVKTSTVPPVVIQQQIVQPTTQQGVATPTKQPIVVQQSQLLMHAQHTNVRPPTLKAHVLNSQKQLQQATLTPIPSPNQPQHSTIVIGGNNTTSIGGTSVPTATSASHHVIQSNIVARHNVQLPPTSTAAVLQHQQLLVNIPTAHSPHGVSTATQALLNSPRVQPQQTLVIKQGGTAIQSQQPSSQATQILHVVTSKANAVTGLPQQQHQTIYSVSQQQHAYMTNSASGIKQQQQQITVLPVEQAQHHVKQQQQQQQQALQHVTLQQKQMQPQSIGVSVVAHQQQNQATTLSSKQSQQQQTLILPAGLQQLNMPPHSNMVLQAKQLPTGMPAHLHAQQLTPSPPATTISKQNPVVHNLQNQSTTPKMSSSPPAALKIQQQLSQQPQTTMLAGTPTNLRTAIPSISPQGQARVTPLLLPTGMPVTIFEANMHDIGKYGGVPSSTRVTQSPPPAHQQASPITPGESAFSTGALRGVPPPREPFMIYQQLLRSQESMNASLRCANEYEEKMLGSSPPLELRRPGSVPRTITVPHSLQSPQDRTSDSPQAAQIYVHNSRIPHPHYPSDVTTSRGFYDAAGRQITIEPPPAHRSAAGSSPFMSTPPAVHPPPPPSTPTAVTAATAAHIHAGNLIEREREREREQQDRLKVTGAVTGHDSMVISAAMSTPTGRNMQVATPTHGSQVPPPQPNADSLLTLLQRYPVMWQGLLALKTDQAAVQMHFVFGNPHVARASLPCNSDGSTPPLRIAQRMRLEQTQLEGVAKKMQFENEHCMLLALPCGRDHADVLQHSRNLQTGFITYLQQKMAAGIVNIPVPGSEQAAYVVHIFPSCDFANENLERAAPDLKNRVAEIAHLLIVIATV